MPARLNCTFGLLKSILLSLMLTAGIFQQSIAQKPSASQIAAFQAMSPAEQKALARSLGVDTNSLSGGQGKSYMGSPTEPISGQRSKQNTTGMFDRQGDAIERFSSDATETPTLQEDEAEASISESLSLFGYKLFENGADSFTPASDIPVPSDYVLGPGDNIVVQLYGKENTNHVLTLSREGSVMFPSIGPVSLAGLTFTSAVTKINEIVNEQMIGVKSSVTMGALRTIRIFILGEAQLPGSYVVGSLSTMTNAIFASGGINKIGSLRNIELKRKGKTVTKLDLYDLLLNGDTSKDSRLLPGDVIFIPPIGRTIGVSGEVKRPAIYELKSERTVQDALALAGGLMPTAYMPASRIERITNAGEKTLVNLDVSTTSGRQFKVRDADVIQIFATLDTMKDIVKLDGHVKRPGGFAWRNNMRFTDIVSSADNLLPDPDIEIGLIQREKKQTRKIEILTFSPKKAFLAPDSIHDPKLQPRDEVILFNYLDNRAEQLENIVEKLAVQANFEEQKQSIHVYGAVRFEGQYPKAKNITAQEAILLAGGLTESALASDAEITRYRLNEMRERVVVHTIHDLHIEEPTLQEGDTLRVRKVPFWDEQESIQILGEVYYPGTYAILPGESMTDVIERAGGLTPRAFPEGAIFSRQQLRDLEAERLVGLKRDIEKDIAAANIEQSETSGDIDKEEAEVILDTFDQVTPLGRMVIDLPSVMKTPEKYDFQLVGNDVIEIPRFKPSVTVLGEVQYTTSHFFDEKLSVEDYLERSGGLNRNADKERIYVIKANGLVYVPKSSGWFKTKDENISPGDTIIVPIDTKKVDKLTLWGSVTTIMYQAALGVAAIGSL